MNIPIFKLAFEDDFREKFERGCNKIFDSGILTNGPYVIEFEEKFAALCNTAYALAVNSGTSALETVLRALDVIGKKVIMPTNTFIATAVSVENAGGLVCPIDIEDETFAVSPDALKTALEEDNIGAVIVVHIGGTISRHIGEIVNLCKQRGVPLIEDAAHAHGAQYKGKRAGSFGTAGCFSFFPTKVMTTAEGGMVTTNDRRLYELMRSIRQFGQDLKTDYLHIRSGSNFKMTEFQALLGLLELERVTGRIARRNKLADVYHEELDGCSWKVVVPPRDSLSSCYKQIVISPVDPDNVRAFCKSRNIALTGEVYRYPIHKQPVYKGNFLTEQFPIADAFCMGHICPPLYPELYEEEIEYICSVLNALKT